MRDKHGNVIAFIDFANRLGAIDVLRDIPTHEREHLLEFLLSTFTVPIKPFFSQ